MEYTLNSTATNEHRMNVITEKGHETNRMSYVEKPFLCKRESNKIE